MGKLLGWLGACTTPLCGGIYGYFCVKCRHYTSVCRCGDNTGGCACEGRDYRKWWAGSGERRMLEQRLAAEEERDA